MLSSALAFAAEEGFASEQPGLVFEESVYQFGEVFEGEIVRTKFSGINQSDKKINILRARASCGCTVVKVSREAVGPGEDVTVDVQFDSTGKRGRARKRVWLETDDEAHPVVNMFIEGFVNRTASGHPVMGEGKNIFSPGCASCHMLKGRNQYGAKLYSADCAMCHGEKREGSEFAPALNWTYGFAKNEQVLKSIIATGSTNPMMPGFGKDAGGPLDGKQIDSLVGWLKVEAEREEGLVAKGLIDPNPRPSVKREMTA